MEGLSVMQKVVVLFFSCAVMVAGGCTSTFLVGKDCRSYFFGSNDEGLYRMLCESGDFRRVLEGTALPQETKDAFYRYNCVQPFPDKVKELYVSLTSEEKRDLRFSFQKQGYYINYKPTRIMSLRDPYGYGADLDCYNSGY